MNQFTPRANMPENNIPFSSKKALDTTYIPQEELNQANQAKAQEKSDIISKTKNLTAAIVGASALTLNVATADITPDHSNMPKEKALSSTDNMAGITTSRDIKVGFGKPAEAAHQLHKQLQMLSQQAYLKQNGGTTPTPQPQMGFL